MSSFYRGKGFSQSDESNAEADLGRALQVLKLKNLIQNIGLTNVWIPIKFTKPDRVLDFSPPPKALYLDGEKVHDMDDPWDQEVDASLKRLGWIVFRERYHGSGLRGKRLIKVLVDLTGLEPELIQGALK